MEQKINEVEINGIVYIPKTSINQQAEKFDGMEYVIVRTQSAGVFAGYLQKKDGQEITLNKARRLWYWDGAASLSQLAQDGTSKPQNCKFPVEMDQVHLLQSIEIINVTEKGKKSIQGVSIWQS